MLSAEYGQSGAVERRGVLAADAHFRARQSRVDDGEFEIFGIDRLEREVLDQHAFARFEHKVVASAVQLQSCAVAVYRGVAQTSESDRRAVAVGRLEAQRLRRGAVGVARLGAGELFDVLEGI